MALYEHSYQLHNISLSEYAEKLDIVAKRRYIDKLTIEKTDGGIFYFPDPYYLPDLEWNLEMSIWPKVTSRDITEYLSKAPGKNSKAMSAFDYVTSGKVDKVKIYNPAQMMELMILTANVSASQRSSVSYKPWVLCQKNGEVRSAHCTCMAGLGEACSHIAAILYKVELAVKLGLTSAVTEKKCEWNNKCNKKVDPAPMSEIKFKKSEWLSAEKPKVKLSQTPIKRRTASKQDLQELQNIAPDAVFFTGVSLNSSSSESDTDSASEEENCELPLTMPYICKNYVIRKNDDLMPFFNAEKIKNVEEKTRSQSGSKIWVDQRRGRVTSFKFGELIKKKRVSKDFIKKFTSPTSELNVEAAKWGREKESVAFQVYCNAAKTNHLGFECRKTGMFIFPSSPFLSTSPDGFVECVCCGKGVLEIKSTFKHRNEFPKSIPAKDKTFCLNSDGTMKETHNYYAQIQGQMAITETEYCDFVVWTTKDVWITRVQRDRHFWDKNYPILKDFFFRHVVPQLESE